MNDRARVPGWRFEVDAMRARADVVRDKLAEIDEAGSPAAGDLYEWAARCGQLAGMVELVLVALDRALSALEGEPVPEPGPGQITIDWAGSRGA